MARNTGQPFMRVYPKDQGRANEKARMLAPDYSTSGLLAAFFELINSIAFCAASFT